MCAYSVILYCQQKSKHPIRYRRPPNWVTVQLGYPATTLAELVLHHLPTRDHTVTGMLRATLRAQFAAIGALLLNGLTA